jgi:hypothetical protein
MSPLMGEHNLKEEHDQCIMIACIIFYLKICAVRDMTAVAQIDIHRGMPLQQSSCSSM